MIESSNFDVLLKDIDNYISYIDAQKGLSHNTQISYNNDLHIFYEYLKRENIYINSITRSNFRNFLFHLNSEKYSSTSVNRIISAIKGFIKYKIRYGYEDSASILEVELQKTKKHLPVFLFDDELNQLISFNCSKKEDFRDKAIFELIFATGVRVSELVSVNCYDINSNREIKIKKGKGNKERVVIYGEFCELILASYLKYRDEFNPNDDALFLNHSGNRLSERMIRYIINKRIDEVSMIKKISPHSLRHSFATSMVRNGANIRSVQSLLGHESIATTQIYTHLTPDDIKDTYKRFHPHGR